MFSFEELPFLPSKKTEIRPAHDEVVTHPGKALISSIKSLIPSSTDPFGDKSLYWSAGTDRVSKIFSFLDRKDWGSVVEEGGMMVGVAVRGGRRCGCEILVWCGSERAEQRSMCNFSSSSINSSRPGVSSI